MAPLPRTPALALPLILSTCPSGLGLRAVGAPERCRALEHAQTNTPSLLRASDFRDLRALVFGDLSGDLFSLDLSLRAALAAAFRRCWSLIFALIDASCWPSVV